MSTMLKEVYDALKEAGASEEKASAAAVAVSAYQLDRERLATKDDIAALKEDIAVVRTEIERMGRVVVMWNVGTFHCSLPCLCAYALHRRWRLMSLEPWLALQVTHGPTCC
jgi:hypothetical protein